MLRLLLRSLAINVAAVYLVTQILVGVVSYVGGIQTLVLAAIAISLANLVVRPIINLLLLPINLVSLGLFRWVANLGVLYAVTWMVPNFQVHPFTFPGLNLKYLIVPSISFSVFGAFLVTTVILTLVFHFMYWLLQD